MSGLRHWSSSLYISLSGLLLDLQFYLSVRVASKFRSLLFTHPVCVKPTFLLLSKEPPKLGLNAIFSIFGSPKDDQIILRFLNDLDAALLRTTRGDDSARCDRHRAAGQAERSEVKGASTL